MTEAPETSGELATELLDLYPQALPQVYGFLLARCGDAPLAEELTAETFMAAVAAVKSDTPVRIGVGWLIVVARRRLVDHWRRIERQRRSLRLAHQEASVDPWDEVLDVEAARAALQLVTPTHRAVLTLRYLDGLSVPEVAELVGRSVHATEGLLQRARAALRRVYEQGGSYDA